MNANVFDEFIRSIERLIPQGATELRDDFEKNARAAFRGALDKLDVVPREEFEIQGKVLARTREQVDALEARLAILEAAVAASLQKGAPTTPGTDEPAGGSSAADGGEPDVSNDAPRTG